MTSDRNLVVAAWNDPRSPRALTLAAAGGVFMYQGLVDSAHDFARGSVLIGGLLLLAGALLLFVMGRQASMFLRLARDGSTGQGRVTAMKKSRVTGGYVLRYRFQDSAGRDYDGKRVLHQRAAFMWRAGDEGVVRFDPHDPATNAWIGRGVEFDENESAAVVIGTVIDVAHKAVDGAHTAVVRYRYRDHLGGTHEEVFHDAEGIRYKPGDTGEVVFAPRYPALSAWRGKRHAFAIPEAPQVTPRAGTPDMAAPSPFEWQPSTFGLIRRSKYLKRAGLHGIYVLIGMTFWLVSAALFEEWTSGDTVGFALFVGFFLFWFAWNATAGSREVKDWQRLMSAGRAAHGTVSLVEQKREAWGRWTWKPGWVVSYRYIDQRGRSRIGDSGYLSRREAERWRSGDECVILYDPEAPDKTVWIGHPPAH